MCAWTNNVRVALCEAYKHEQNRKIKMMLKPIKSIFLTEDVVADELRLVPYTNMVSLYAAGTAPPLQSVFVCAAFTNAQTQKN